MENTVNMDTTKIVGEKSELFVKVFQSAWKNWPNVPDWQWNN